MGATVHQQDAGALLRKRADSYRDDAWKLAAMGDDKNALMYRIIANALRDVARELVEVAR